MERVIMSERALMSETWNEKRRREKHSTAERDHKNVDPGG